MHVFSFHHDIYVYAITRTTCIPWNAADKMLSSVIIKSKPYLLVDRHMERTIHWLQLIRFIFHLHLVEHGLSIEIEMPRRLPKIEFCDVRCIQKVIASFQMNLFPVRLENMSDHCSFRMPEDQSASCGLRKREKIQICTQASMISAGGCSIVERSSEKQTT